MPKKSKLSTPEWLLGGYSSEEEYIKSKGINKKKISGKAFKIRKCPKCGSDDMGVVIGKEEGEGTGEWECHKCKWVGKNVKEEEISEEEFLSIAEKEEK